ncbi:MAG: ABC transporter permease subunit [Anaerolineales bacterium]|nr:ABC transporter permease subunit [Anaerolineales bacterium]
MRKVAWVAWIIYIFGILYFVLPLFGTFIFSLQKSRGVLSLSAYQSAFADPKFLETFLFSNVMAVCTIIVSLLLVVPTAYWVQLRVPSWRPAVEFVTLLPFVIPAIVLVFGLIKTFGRPVTIFGVPVFPALTTSALSTDFLLVMAYVVLSLPYMYRAVDNGLRAMDVRVLTEAAQSLGAGWGTILWRIIIPNLRSALLSGALLTFAIVVGELTIATFLARPAFGPYLALLGNHKAYEPAALTIISFALTWLAMGLIDLVTRGSKRGPLTGAH